MERRKITVRGIVQGVGFRPFVFGLAEEHGLAGRVVNDARGVVIDVEGEPSILDRFAETLVSKPPPLAVVEAVETETLPSAGFDRFEIEASESGAERLALVSPDVATCEACLREMRDPGDRRHRYPFLNCTNCGPRFTIVEDIPYDRPNTSMKAFPMCPECREEYEDPRDRRFHAQPTACPACGPALAWRGVDGTEGPVGEEAMERAARRLLAGGILAVKGLGGYHLACLAADPEAVGTLRERKRRDAKPFALMVPDLETARGLVELDPVAEELLESIRRPILLAPRRPDARVADGVAPRMGTLGIMLPYTPLHSLLMERVGEPLVMTSGNRSDEPMAYRDEEALERLRPFVDGMLTHDRRIVMRCDDSVVRWTGARVVPMRRARGFAPRPVPMSPEASLPLLALGAQQKNAFCLARGPHAFVSHHIGDLDTIEAAASLEEAVEHYERLFEIEPGAIAHDLHPDYRSTRLARELAEGRGLPRIGVQHHHAHAASVAAEHGLEGSLLGVSLDGTGWGPDGTVWGFEFLAVDGARMRRLGRLEPVALPGGEAAVREPWRTGAAWIRLAYGTLPGLDLPLLPSLDRSVWGILDQLVEKGVNAPLASSAGRLFDAVAWIVGLREEAAFEGQPAMELESLAGHGAAEPYPVELAEKPPEPGGDPAAPGFEVVFRPAIRAIAEDVDAGADPAGIAARFHETVIAAILAGARRAREAEGLEVVALSGGTFQNARVLDGTIDGLIEEGFDVYANESVPPNDGGIALGQAAVAARRLAEDGARAATEPDRVDAAPATPVTG
ncbi:MAG: carbamoyltransferase HypF [Gemmatimonadota bacterium]|nr:carbamoyltransferase HypF [Gemmatimonadota bacterium]